MNNLDILQNQLQQAQDTVAKLQAELEQAKQRKVWKPQGGEWYVGACGEVWEDDSDDGTRLFGTERPTKEAAIKARDEMRVFNRLLAYRDEFDPDFEREDGGDNYFVKIDVERGKYLSDSDCFYKRVGIVYMSEQVAEELATKLNNGEVVL